MMGCFRDWRRQGRWVGLFAATAMIASCNGKNSHLLDRFRAGSDQDSRATTAIEPLDTRLVSAHATDRISLPGLDDKQPAKGNHFVVLDVAVRNTDTQPRVFSEGQIIAANASRERTFPTPVNIFEEGYLQLQVLPPSAGARGKIVYEIPDDASGVLYWVPGGDTRRILLHPDVMAVTAATRAPTRALPPADSRTPVPAPAQPLATQPSSPSDDTAAPANAIAVMTPPVATSHPPGVSSASDRTSVGGQGSVTTPPVTQSSREVNMGGEQARVLACTALVSRNDPAEKKHYLGFFKRECGAYAMPSAWSRPTAHVAMAVPAPDPNRWPPRAGPAFDCEQAFSRAEQLICSDSVLSLMDWELTRAYANAQRSVDDPAALQREQDDWRWHVRNACRTVSCVEAVYTERTADLTALARPQ
jgi:hypothetical protein